MGDKVWLLSAGSCPQGSVELGEVAVVRHDDSIWVWKLKGARPQDTPLSLRLRCRRVVQ